MHTCIHDLLRLFHFAHMYMSSANYLVLENLYGFFLEKTDSPSLSKDLPPVALDIVVGPSRIFPAHVGMSTGVIMLVKLRAHGCSSLSRTEDTVLQPSFWALGPYTFPHPCP